MRSLGKCLSSYYSEILQQLNYHPDNKHHERYAEDPHPNHNLAHVLKHPFQFIHPLQ